MILNNQGVTVNCFFFKDVVGYIVKRHFSNLCDQSIENIYTSRFLRII